MDVVMFVFNADVSSQEQAKSLAHINQWDEIYKAAALHAETKEEELARVGYAYLSEQAAPEAVVRRLSELPEVASAYVPARRRFS